MHSKSAIKRRNLIYGSCLAIVSAICFNSVVEAQGTSTAAVYMPPGQSPNQGALPPPGDGPKQAPVIPGDYYPNQTYINQTNTNVPTGKTVSTPQYGTNFNNQDEKRRSRINLFMSEGRGTRTVLTFEPDQLTDEQRGTVMGILGAVAGSAPYQNILVTQPQLLEIQKVLAPSPDDVAGESLVPMRNTGAPRSQVTTDTPTSGRFSQNGTNGIVPILPRIQQFCRYLVKLGVVCACIFMAFAAISLQFGDRSASGRIVGSMGGIMLLLMGYAIWKVVRVNEDNARGPAVVDLSSPPAVLPSQGYFGDTKRIKVGTSFPSTTYANLPVIPPNPQTTSASNGVQRSGLPLKPLGDAH